MNRFLSAAVASALLLAAVSDGALANSAPQLPQLLGTADGTIFTSTSSQNTWQVMYTAGASGSWCRGISVTTNDGTHPFQLTVRKYHGTAILWHLTVNLPIAPGYTNPDFPIITSALTPSLPKDNAGNLYIQLAPGDTLQAAFNGTITSGDALFVEPTCVDF